MKLPLLFACTVLALLHFAEAKPDEPQAPAAQSVSLLELLGGGVKKEHSWQLKRHWVGTLKVISKSPLYEKEKSAAKDEPVRFNTLIEEFNLPGRRGGTPALVSVGNHAFSQFAVHRRELPSAADMQNREKLDAICESFGGQHGFTDGWGDGERMHSTRLWRWFTTADNGRLRVVQIFAHVSTRKGHALQIDEWIICEGLFRPSDPADPKDAAAFPSESVNEDKAHAKQNAKDNKLPEPLRTYVKADHAPGDSEMKGWCAVVRKFRASPDGVLLKQMTARLDDGTCEMAGMLEYLFHADHLEDQTGPWDPIKRRTALTLLLEALPSAQNEHALQSAVELALRETGAESVKLHNSALSVDLSSTRTKSGQKTTMSQFDLKKTKVRRAGEILRDEILRQWQRVTKD